METFLVEGKKVTKDNLYDVANTLLNKSHLKCKNKIYRICEVEFYLLDKTHNDEYTHANKNQMRYGRWYFHRYPNGAYKGGTYKGMDLTLGSPKSNKYCGVLIRSLYDLTNKTMIEGPCKVVNELLSLHGFDNTKDFMAGKPDPLSAVRSKNNSFIYIRDNLTLNEEEIFTTERIGLSDKYPKWRDVHYRFLTKKQLIKKGKKNIATAIKNI